MSIDHLGKELLFDEQIAFALRQSESGTTGQTAADCESTAWGFSVCTSTLSRLFDLQPNLSETMGFEGCHEPATLERAASGSKASGVPVATEVVTQSMRMTAAAAT